MEKILLTWQQIEADTLRLCEDIKQNLPDYKNLELVCISRGGLFVGGLISYALGIKNVHCVALESYEEDKDGSNGKVRSRTPFLGSVIDDDLPHANGQLNWAYKDRTFLFVDDINDTSQTYQFVKDQCAEYKINYYFGTIYHKVRSNNLTPDFYAQPFEPAAWVEFPWDKLGK